jgi:DNA invertase Pin-like site-specific DNA recombinase
MNQDQTHSDKLSEQERYFLRTTERTPVTVGYVRISPSGPDPATAAAIYEYADYYGWAVFGIVFETVSGMTGWHNRDELKWMADTLKDGDRLVVEELSQMGRNVPDVVNLLARLHERGVTVCDVKNRWLLDATISSQMMAMFCAISGQIDRGHISMRTREGLAARKAKGLRLGRKKGTPAPSKLDAHKSEIIDLLRSGSTKTYIMRKFATSKTNLYHWLKINKLDDVSPDFGENEKTR